MFEKIKTGISGFDDLLGDGIERGSVVLVSGDTGTGKTNFCSQVLHYNVSNGKRGLYVTFEEPPDQIKRHVAKLGIDFGKLEDSGKARFVKIDIYQIAKALKAIFLETRGEKMIKEGLPGILLKKEEYRSFIFQLFSRFKEIGATTFAVAEAGRHPSEYSRSRIEEFLADGVIVLYNLEHEDLRVNAIEVLKLRGTKHEKRRVPFKITEKGIVVYPKSQVFNI